MLDKFFMEILDMSRAAALVILVVMGARLLLKRFPKVLSYGLWAVVLFRLLCPFSLESPVSLIPDMTPVSENDAMPEESVSLPEAVGEAFPGDLHTPAEGQSPVQPQIWEVLVLYGKYVWLLGMGLMALYSISSYYKLKKRLTGVSLLRDNIYLSDYIESPFVMGLFRPKIYLPSSLSERERGYIILHEQHHIHRGDHLIKCLSFLALTLHWFNPLVWAAFFLSENDMEMSCDEAVIRKQGDQIRADYSASLLSLATGRRIAAGTPLSFGEGNTKSRIRNLARLKKPALWLMAAALVLVLTLGVLLMTRHPASEKHLMGADYAVKEVLYAVTVGEEPSTPPPLSYTITGDFHLYQQISPDADKEYLGRMKPFDLTNQMLKHLTPVETMRDRYRVAPITEAYGLKTSGDNFYVAFQTRDGKTYAGYGWQSRTDADSTRLRRLYQLESTFKEHGFDSTFFSRSLTHTTGKQVDAFGYFENDRSQGYVAVGFMAGPHLTDMGFAVFRQGRNNGYRLLDWHLYENAAVTGNGIIHCPHPAVMSSGTPTNQNTYDVILSCNKDLARIERVPDKGKKQTDIIVGSRSMTLFSWQDDKDSQNISLHFYDKNGEEMSGISPSYPAGDYQVSDITYADGRYDFSYTVETAPYYTVTDDGKLKILEDKDSHNWLTAGQLVPISLTEENFDALERIDLLWEEGQSMAKLRQDNRRAFGLTVSDSPSGVFYYMLEQKSGERYLCYGYTGDAEREPSVRWIFRLTGKNS